MAIYIERGNKHKKYFMYNNDKVKDKIGIGSENYIYDKLDVFSDRLNKNVGWGIITYKDFENNKEVEKQYVVYTENEKDIQDLIDLTRAREVKVHQIDVSHTYFYVSADSKDYADMNYVEYSDGKNVRNTMKVKKTWIESISKVVYDYRMNDSRITKAFDGYNNPPIKKSYIPRMERKKNAMPMPLPSITSLVIKDIKKTIEAVKDYVLIKLGIANNEIEFENGNLSIENRIR